MIIYGCVTQYAMVYGVSSVPDLSYHVSMICNYRLSGERRKQMPSEQDGTDIEEK